MAFGAGTNVSGARFDDDIVDKVLSSGHRADVAKLRRTDPPDNPEPPEPVEAPPPPLAPAAEIVDINRQLDELFDELTGYAHGIDGPPYDRDAGKLW